MEKIDQPYFGNWDKYQDLTTAWDNISSYRSDDKPVVLPTNFPTEAEVLIAIYDVDGYEGQSFVLYARDGKLFENHSSHCSCNGLEWGPEETTWAALAIRPRKDYWGRDSIDSFYGRHGDDAAVTRFWRLVDEQMAKLSNLPDDSTPC